MGSGWVRVAFPRQQDVPRCGLWAECRHRPRCDRHEACRRAVCGALGAGVRGHWTIMRNGAWREAGCTEGVGVTGVGLHTPASRFWCGGPL